MAVLTGERQDDRPLQLATLVQALYRDETTIEEVLRVAPAVNT